MILNMVVRMKRKSVDRDQFHIFENRVEHIPTGFWISTYPNSATPASMHLGMLGSQLENGDEYFEVDVKEMALILLREKFQNIS